MRKVFVVVKTRVQGDLSTTQAVAAFEQEANAQRSAQRWADAETHAWVDEVNLYE